MTATGYIDGNGKYHRGEDAAMGHNVNSMHKQWRHDGERRKYSREIVQPRINGQPNPEFVRSYPEESKEYFTPEQIRKAERQL